jgi:hypothetical protein
MVTVDSESQPDSVVAALAGRRIDVPGEGDKQFPLENAPRVREALQRLFIRDKVQHLTCSAACGADLLALDVALQLGVECNVILPFDVQLFRTTSVIDRPGDWGTLYDRIIHSVSEVGRLIILNCDSADASAYEVVTHRIISETLKTVAQSQPLALIVLVGRPPRYDDWTAQFLKK